MSEIDIPSTYILLQGVRRKQKTLSSAWENQQGRKFIEKVDRSGWLSYLYVTVNYSDVKIKCKYDNSISWEFSADELLDLGLDETDGIMPYISQYDDANSRYTIMFKPRNFCFDRLEIETNRSSGNYTIRNFQLEYFELTNKTAFGKSLATLSKTGAKSR